MGYAKSAFVAMTAEGPESIAARHEKELVARTLKGANSPCRGQAAVR